MSMLLTWHYIDPANGSEYERELVLEDVWFKEAFEYIIKHLPVDQLIDITISDYSK